MIQIIYDVEWNGEMEAGIRPGSERVTLQLEYTHEVDADSVEFFRDCLASYFDGAGVKFNKIVKP